MPLRHCGHWCAKAVSIHANHYWQAMPGSSSELFDMAFVSIHAHHYWRAMQGKGRSFYIGSKVSVHAHHYWRAMRRVDGL